MEYKEASYSFKVWLTTITVAPLLLVTGMYISGDFRGDGEFGTLSEFPGTWLLVVVGGGIFSLFTFGLFYMAVKITTYNITSVRSSKCIISFCGVLLSATTFAAIKSLIDLPFLYIFGYFPLCYYACVAAFSWLYNLTKPSDDSETTPAITNS